MYVLPFVVTIFVRVSASGTANLIFEPITRLEQFFAWREGSLTIQLVLYPGLSLGIRYMVQRWMICFAVVKRSHAGGRTYPAI